MIHAFSFLDTHVLLDVESGAVHELDAEAFAVARALEAGEDPYAAGVPKHIVDEVLGELRQLEREGALNAAPAEAPDIGGGAVVKSMCLHVAHDCNLRCRYCFASTGDFHGERMLMTEDVAKRALEFLVKNSGGRKHLEVDLFGGEPLLNWPLCAEIVRYGRKLEKEFNKEIHFTITTNCVALTDEMADFVNREMHNVVISLDGRRDVHDALRPTANGRGSYDIIVEKAKRLVAGRGEKEYYIRGTFTRNNLDFAEDVKHLAALGFDQLSVEPVVLPEDDPLSITREHLPRVREEYLRLAEHYLNERKHGRWFNFFHFNVDLEGGPCLRKRLTGCGAGEEYVAVAPDGTLYPCHQFVGQAGWAFGNVFDGTLDENIRKKFSGCSVATKLACKGCWAKYFCSGGCAANASLYSGDIMVPHEISCELMRMRAECALGVYAKERR